MSCDYLLKMEPFLTDATEPMIRISILLQQNKNRFNLIQAQQISFSEFLYEIGTIT